MEEAYKAQGSQDDLTADEFEQCILDAAAAEQRHLQEALGRALADKLRADLNTTSMARRIFPAQQVDYAEDSR